MNITTKISEKYAELVTLSKQISSGRQQFLTPIPGLSINYWEYPNPPTSHMMEASLCLIVQGKKQVILGEENYTYTVGNFMISAIDLPVISNILEATPEIPYIGLLLKLDTYVLSQLIMETNTPFKQENITETKGVAVGTITLEMIDAFIRLLNLINHPEDQDILAPMILKEIFYRLLMSPQSERLKQIATTQTTSHRIVKAVDWLKNNYEKKFKVESLAESMGMSPSSFHQHFKDITTMSPLQYHKRLRLIEARRLLIVDHVNVSSTSIKVGYESLSQFSREYKRLFGISPSSEIV